MTMVWNWRNYWFIDCNLEELMIDCLIDWLIKKFFLLSGLLLRPPGFFVTWSARRICYLECTSMFGDTCISMLWSHLTSNVWCSECPNCQSQSYQVRGTQFMSHYYYGQTDWLIDWLIKLFIYSLIYLCITSGQAKSQLD